MPGQARTAEPLASGFTRVAVCALGAATVLGALVGYVISRVILRGD